MLNQVQTQKQNHTILPQQIELLNLFHLDTLQLEQRIRDELSENPVLEETPSQDELPGDKGMKDKVQDFQNWEEYAYDDIPDYKTEYHNYLPEDKIPEKPMAEIVDVRDELKKQCRWLPVPEEKHHILDFVIDSLNEYGFLDQDVEELASEYSFRKKVWVETVELEEAIVLVRELEPRGAGCRTIQEYLLFQLRKMQPRSPDAEAMQPSSPDAATIHPSNPDAPTMHSRNPDVVIAIRLLENHFQDLRTCNLERIKKQLHLDDDEVRIVLSLLSHLKTRPFEPVADPIRINTTILPDLTVQEDEDGSLVVALYRQRSSNLYISHTWVEMVQNAAQNTSIDKSTKQYLRSKLASANWFINAIQQRESNILKIMNAIVTMQYAYFGSGDILLLQPMKLKDIADKVGVDISTVSRLTCNKYVETPFGIILLKDLFTEGIRNKEGNDISNKVIQNIMVDLVFKEDKYNPYTDRQLVSILAARGYSVARRTVAKYRELLHIPVAQIRGLWHV